MKIFYKLLPCLLICLWLSGCTLAPTGTVSGAPDRTLQTQLESINGWQIEGKLAVRSAQASDSARLQWKQEGEAFDIHLSGPAGLKATHIYGMPGGVIFEQGEHTERAGSAETLSQKLIGWRLPTTELTFWLRGLPSVQHPAKSLHYTPEGWLAQLEQEGWKIHFSEYRHIDHLVLPGRIEAVRGDTRITLIIKQWKLP